MKLLEIRCSQSHRTFISRCHLKDRARNREGDLTGNKNNLTAVKPSASEREQKHMHTTHNSKYTLYYSLQTCQKRMFGSPKNP